MNQLYPFVSAAIMLIFTVSVFKRWWLRRQPNFLFWGLGLAMFVIGSFAEAYFTLWGWSAVVFFSWYLFGAALNAAWIGHGTFLLLVRKSWRQVVTALLLVGSLIATLMMLGVMGKLNPAGFDPSVSISEQYREILPAVQDGAAVRLITPFFNIYGLLTLVGGALWSSWLYIRKRVHPNRVLGNVIIATGALSIGLASTLTRVGFGAYLYLGELIAAVLMYSGFMIASQPEAQVVKKAELSPSQA